MNPAGETGLPRSVCGSTGWRGARGTPRSCSRWAPDGCSTRSRYSCSPAPWAPSRPLRRLVIAFWLTGVAAMALYARTGGTDAARRPLETLAPQPATP